MRAEGIRVDLSQVTTKQLHTQHLINWLHHNMDQDTGNIERYLKASRCRLILRHVTSSQRDRSMEHIIGPGCWTLRRRYSLLHRQLGQAVCAEMQSVKGKQLWTTSAHDNQPHKCSTIAHVEPCPLARLSISRCQLHCFNGSMHSRHVHFRKEEKDCLLLALEVVETWWHTLYAFLGLSRRR